jgi:hypothetical protein
LHGITCNCYLNTDSSLFPKLKQRRTPFKPLFQFSSWFWLHQTSANDRRNDHKKSTATPPQILAAVNEALPANKTRKAPRQEPCQLTSQQPSKLHFIVESKQWKQKRAEFNTPRV